MTFTCAHCGKSIHGVSTVVDKKIVHHNCLDEYMKNKEENVEIEE